MTQEEKAKAYDEALERAKDYKNNIIHKEVPVGTHIMDYIFPELAESEDEQSKKWILEYLYDGLRKSDEQFKSQFKAAISWIEKQGEQKETACDKCRKAQPNGSCQDITALGRCYIEGERKVKDTTVIYHESGLKALEESLEKGCTEGEQKPNDKVEPKFKEGDKIISTISNIPYYITEVCNGHYLTDVGCVIMFNAQDNFELSNPNPAWSEEDEKMYLSIMSVLLSTIGTDKTGFTVTREIDWLKSLKDRVQPQPKQEWSEEDERMLNHIIGYLHSGDDFQTGIDWLKSLKERYTWKPSDEQMEEMQKALVDLCGKDEHNIITGLYYDLKKLR